MIPWMNERQRKKEKNRENEFSFVKKKPREKWFVPKTWHIREEEKKEEYSKNHERVMRIVRGIERHFKFWKKRRRSPSPYLSLPHHFIFHISHMCCPSPRSFIVSNKCIIPHLIHFCMVNFEIIFEKYNSFFHHHYFYRFRERRNIVRKVHDRSWYIHERYWFLSCDCKTATRLIVQRKNFYERSTTIPSYRNKIFKIRRALHFYDPFEN